MWQNQWVFFFQERNDSKSRKVPRFILKHKEIHFLKKKRKWKDLKKKLKAFKSLLFSLIKKKTKECKSCHYGFSLCKNFIFGEGKMIVLVAECKFNYMLFLVDLNRQLKWKKKNLLRCYHVINGMKLGFLVNTKSMVFEYLWEEAAM